MIEGVEAMEAVGEYFDAMLYDLSPAKRKKVAVKIARELRRRNRDRIKRNVELDGGKMAPRKRKRRIRRGKRSIKSGLMFRNLYKADHLKFHATPDSAKVYFANPIAARHHSGGRMAVGRDSQGRRVEGDFPARPLLGLDSEDMDALTEELLKWFDDNPAWSR